MIDIGKRLLDDRVPRDTSADAAEFCKKSDTARHVHSLFATTSSGTRQTGAHLLGGAGLERISLKTEKPDPIHAEIKARANALLPAVRAKAGAVSLPALEVLDFIARRSMAEGGEPVRVLRSDIASAMNSDVATVDAHLNTLRGANLLRTVRTIYAERLLPTL